MVLFREEIPPQRWPHAERGEEVLRNPQAVHPFGDVSGEYAEPDARGDGEPLEHGTVILEVAELRVCDGQLAPVPLICLRQAHQAVGLVVRQRLEQHTVNEAEDRRVGPDPQREREHRDGGESGALGERPACVPQVGEQGVHHSDLNATIGSTFAARRAGT